MFSKTSEDDNNILTVTFDDIIAVFFGNTSHWNNTVSRCYKFNHGDDVFKTSAFLRYFRLGLNTRIL